jgi:hypothetical protein
VTAPAFAAPDGPDGTEDHQANTKQDHDIPFVHRFTPD